MKKLVVTERLNQLLEEYKSYDGIVEYVSSFLEHHIGEYSRLLQEYKPYEVAANFHYFLDDFIKKHTSLSEQKISCRKGCSHCCNMLVDINEHEGQLIVEYCKEKKIPIDKEKLIRQSKYKNVYKWFSQKDPSCIFLKDNLCSIYEVRPMRCRKYFVVSDPELCNISNTNLVAQFVAFEIECLVSAIDNILKTFPLPDVLLKLIS